MTTSIHALAANPPSGRKRPLLLDHDAYTTAVIRQGASIPWANLEALTGFVQQAHGLLDPDAVWLDTAALYAAFLAEHPDLVTAMGARTRTAYALRTLLNDDEGVALVSRTAIVLAEAARRPVVLSIPSPGRWLALAQAIAGQPVAEVDADDADTACMYLAEWLGKLSSVPVALVLLDASGDAAGAAVAAESLAGCTSITNVGAHLDWSVAMRRCDDIELAAATVGVLSGSYWSQGGEPPTGDVLVASIPADAHPEQVLEHLARL